MRLLNFPGVFSLVNKSIAELQLSL